MRYNLDSTLPINAFSPRGGIFAYGMTLEGGGGGGILKPVTKAIGSVVGGATKAVKAVVDPVYNATFKQIPGVDKALVGLDKAVGKSIPGGWGTVAAVASSFIPGAQFGAQGLLSGITRTQLATGLGALSGSGVMRKGNNFNLQGAIMGGAMAYGASQLSQGFQDAGKIGTETAAEAAAKSASNAGGDVISNFNNSQMLTGPGAELANIPAFDPSSTAGNSFAYTPSGEMVPSNIAPSITGAAPIMPSVPSPTGLESLAEAGKGTLSNIADAGTGIKNLAGFGADGSAAAARSAFTAPITTAGLTGLVMGGSGLAALEEQQKYLDSQLASGNIAQAEYDAAKARIDEQIAIAQRAVSENPLQSSADISGIKNEDTTYNKQNDISYAAKPMEATLYDKDPTGGTMLYAMGGAVNPRDDQTNLPNQTPMQRFENNGLMSMIGNTAPQQTFASGGMPRFLSGGGDGMSDSIKASINGSQEARLADGEFVIPADVVSHIGNGSSKAGAKQLYSMMDRVRQARVGNKKQGKQINPRKFLAA